MVDVLVVAEAQGDAPSRNSLEVLGAARALADGTQGAVKAAVLGGAVEGLAAALFAGGADEVLWVEHPLLAEPGARCDGRGPGADGAAGRRRRWS